VGLWDIFIYWFFITICGNMGLLEDGKVTCKIDSKNRITLPPGVMSFLNLSSGDLVSIERNGSSLSLHKAYICVKRNSKNFMGCDI